jgi:NADPH-dependent curcumin reductase CurA
MTENTRVLLKRRCVGVPVAEDFEVSSAAPELPDNGQLLCETIFLSLDPYLRGRISGRHMSGSVSPGELMPGEAISRVIDSKHSDFSAGDIVSAFSGWQQHSVVNASEARKIDPAIGPLSTFLGILGMPGLTAEAGL